MSLDHGSSVAAPGRQQPVLVVRPYDERIRSRVFHAMEQAGGSFSDEDQIPTGTGDEQAIQWVLRHPARILLVPFHGHRAEDGHSLDGLHFLVRLHQAASGTFPWRVVMPYSRFAAAAVDLRVRSRNYEREYPRELREALLLLSEDDLDRPDVATRIAAHLFVRDGARR